MIQAMYNDIFIKSCKALSNIEWDAYLIHKAYPMYCISYNVDKNTAKFTHDIKDTRKDTSYKKMLGIMFRINERLKQYAQRLRIENDELTEINIFGYFKNDSLYVYDIELEYKQLKQCVYLTRQEYANVIYNEIKEDKIKVADDIITKCKRIDDILPDLYDDIDNDDTVMIRPSNIVLYSAYSKRIMYFGKYKNWLNDSSLL